MQIAKQLAGFTPAEAETLRKAIGKKIHELMASLKGKFLEGCVATGTEPEVAQQLSEGHGPPAGLLTTAGLYAIGAATGIGFYGMVLLLAALFVALSLWYFLNTRWYLFPSCT